MAQEDNNAISDLADILEGTKPIPAAPIQNEVETPANEPPAAPQQPATPPTNESNSPQDKQPDNPTPLDFNAELLKNSGGVIKSKEDLDALIQRSNAASDLEGKLKTYEDENTSLKAKVAIDPFANDYTKKLNELYKSGASDAQIQAFTTLNKVKDLDGLSPVDARLLALQIKEGLTEDEARMYLNASYRLNPDEHDEDTIKSENIRLKVDANADRQFLKQHKAEVSQAPENPAEIAQREYQQKQAAQVAKLEPLAKNVLKDLPNLFKGVSINGKDGDQSIKTDFEASPESVKGIAPLVQQFIESNWENLKANEDGVQQIKAYAENLLAIQNWRTWVINAASARELQVRAEYNNPTPINRGQDAPNPGKGSREEFDKKLLDTYY